MSEFGEVPGTVVSVRASAYVRDAPRLTDESKCRNLSKLLSYDRRFFSLTRSSYLGTFALEVMCAATALALVSFRYLFRAIVQVQQLVDQATH